MTKKTKRLYFDCPIIALYMMKEFGIRLVTGDMGYYGYQDCLPYTLSYLMMREKFYVAPESKAIFKPKEDDVVSFLGKITTIDSEYSEKYPSDQSLITMEAVTKTQSPIVMRDCKQFFSAKEEV